MFGTSDEAGEEGQRITTRRGCCLDRLSSPDDYGRRLSERTPHAYDGGINDSEAFGRAITLISRKEVRASRGNERGFRKTMKIEKSGSEAEQAQSLNQQLLS